MDSGTVTLIVALSVPFIGAISALSLGFYQERSKREALTVQVLANKAAISQKETEMAQKQTSDENSIARELRAEIRGDNQQLRLQIAEQEKHMRSQDDHMHEQDKQMLDLSNKIDILTRDVKASHEGMRVAEESAQKWQAVAHKEATEKEVWKAKYEGESAASALLSNLYQSARSGKEADVALLTTIEGTLLRSGYLQPPAKLSKRD